MGLVFCWLNFCTSLCMLYTTISIVKSQYEHRQLLRGQQAFKEVDTRWQGVAGTLSHILHKTISSGSETNKGSSDKDVSNTGPIILVPSKPHIVFIVADDLGYNDVGYHGKRMGSIADTPAIDALAYSGVRLENYYVQPRCTPTRASLLTGRYPIRLGLQVGNIDVGDSTCLPLDETTLSEKLRDLGYATHAVGKWHLGFSRPACLPTRRGFESFIGILMGHATHIDQTRANINALFTNESAEWSYSNESNHIYSSELYTQHAVNIITNHNSSQPLFLYLSHQAPHSPMEALRKYQTGYMLEHPDIWNAMAKKRISSLRRDYLGLVKSLDDSVHTVTETLKDAGIWNNTVLVFTSDNGGRGSGAGNNWPLRGRKGALFEGGIKAVGLVNSPLLPTRVVGTIQNGLMHVSDWFPTLVEGVAGGKTRDGRLPLDGMNLWPTISKGSLSPRSEILHNIKTQTPSTKERKSKRESWEYLRKDCITV
ncbi:arylsulfatase B-like [Amphiura filiformis]|uniref:arylsulfatase B-like n=1 Tax=Amphiura filiformis TaxID=82378 RepID=UPI003B216C7A